MGKLKDLTGQKFGKLTVIERAENQGKYTCWLCKCECGTLITVRSTNLLTGNTKSCGCYKKDKAIIDHTIHNLSNHRIYKIWENMKSRCYRKTTINYERYGGRGIKVCNEWQQFEPFNDWAIKNGYKEDLTLDRIDVNGNYEPDNCRWLSVKEQNRNTRTNRLITYKGETHCVSEWAEILGINAKLIYDRLRKNWTIEEVLETPLLRKNKVGHKGIIETPYGNYRVRLFINKVRYQKTFKTLEEAINYRDEIVISKQIKEILE